MATVAEELPFAAAVTDDHLDKTCSSCFSSEGSKSRCIGCKVVVYCDKVCQKKDWIDHKHECSFLKNCAPQIPPVICRQMARIAMKLKRPDAKKPAFNGRVYDDLMDHCDEIRRDSDRMKTVSFFSKVLREYMGDKVPESDLLLSIYGKAEIHSFGIEDVGRALYVGFSIHNHSCIPDVYLFTDGCKAFLRSPDPKKKYSKDLTVAYTNLLSSNKDRQQRLRTTHYFTCTCARCSDPSLDFVYNSARSACCPDSCCLLDTDVKELACNKCGSVSEITVDEAVAANEVVRGFGIEIFMKTTMGPNVLFDLPTLIEAYEKYSKILSPWNLNLLQLNDALCQKALSLNQESPVARKYALLTLPAYRRYLIVGNDSLSEKLRDCAFIRSYEFPPTREVLQLFEEAFAAFLVSHGPGHHQTWFVNGLLANYRDLLQQLTRGTFN